MVIDIKIPKTKKEYNELNERLALLWDKAEPGTAEGEEFELLILLKNDYEKKNYVMPSADPVSLIKFKMDQLDLNAIDLVPFIGHKSTVSRILNRERKLTIEMIEKLSIGLNIPIELFFK